VDENRLVAANSKSPSPTAFLIPLAMLFAVMTAMSNAFAAGKPGGVRLPTMSETIHEKLKPLQASMKARQPVSVTGDTLTYDSRSNVYTAIGNAKAVEGITTLTGDVISLRDRTQIHAAGHVHLTDPDSNISAREATLNLATEEATLWDAKVYAFNRSYYLSGTKVQKTLGQHYHAENALITTCTCDSNNPDWSLTAKQMNLHLNGEMQGYSGDFNVLGHPLIPLPYLQYNTDPNRHSGLLSPQFGYSNLRGAYLLQPYYLDLGPSQDATAAGDYESSARVGGLFEYRRIDSTNDYFQFTTSYYNESFRSESNRESDIVDPQIANPNIPINRWGIVGLMQEHLTPSLLAYGTAASSGDSLFFREMNTPVLSSEYGWNSGTWQSTRAAVSNLGLIQEFDNSYLNLGGVWNQDLIQPQKFALQTLPSLTWTGYQNIDHGLAYLTYNSQAVNYWRQEGVDGTRFDLDPQLTIPWLWSNYLNGWATAGADAAEYDVSGHQVDVIPVGTKGRIYNNNLALGPLEPGGLMGRVVPNLELGMRTALLGHSDLSWLNLGKVTALTVPTVEYDYVPTVNQSRFPLFDETDRIEARSLITYGFSTRFFLQTNETNPLSGNFSANIAHGRVGPVFSTANGYTEEILRVSVEQAYDTTYAIAPGNSHTSDIELNGSIFPNRIISGLTQVDWSPRSQQRLDGASFGLQFQPPGQKLPNIYTGRESIGSYLQFAYTYAAANAVLQAPSSSENGISMVNMRAYADLSSYMGAYFAPIYDLDAHRLLTDIIGVRFKSKCDCWFVDLGFSQTYNPNDTSVSFQVTLGGLGSIGEAPFGLNPFQVAGFLPAQNASAGRPPIQPGLSVP
jgi:lipopolysaccharide assembly outer membrane protein LptD (OstA)